MPLNTLINAVMNWAERTFVAKSTDEETLELVTEMGLVDPVTDENGAVYVDESGNIYTL